MVELAVVVPTFNEKDNVQPLVDAVSCALEGVDFELVFVDDDSPDGTAHQVLEVSRLDPRVRLVHRIQRRGLSSAVIEGMLATNAPYLAVIDGDMQHDERMLPTMLSILRRGDIDVVVGTRNQAGGGMGEFSEKRVALSQFGRRLSAFVCRAELSDPMSGFFAIRRQFLDEVVHNLSCIGFKILLDLLASSRRPVRIEEVGYTFRSRLHGESKLDLITLFEYLELLLDKGVGQWLPVRYVLFGLVGAVGVAAQIGLILALRSVGDVEFETAQLASSFLVIILNYAVNNQVTFRRRRLRGWYWLRGLALFTVACSIGLYVNLRVASGLFDVGVHWVLASLAGILIASLWNYAMSAIFVWRVNRRRAPA